jgi:hypothetical protein
MSKMEIFKVTHSRAELPNSSSRWARKSRAGLPSRCGKSASHKDWPHIPKEKNKPMKNLRAAIILCTLTLLAMTAFAWQYPSTGQSPSMPSQGSMQPSQTQPSQNPSAQPGQESQQPGSQAQQPQSSAQQPGQGPSIDNQVQILAQQLNLSTDQQAKVKSALEDQHTQAMSIIQDQSLQREQKIQKIHALRQSTIDKVRSTLTSDDQKQKFDQMVQAQDQRMHEQQQQAPPKP